MKLPKISDAKIRDTTNVDIIDFNNIDKEVEKIGLNKTYHIRTYGCAMNEHDSESIKALLEDMGYTVENDYEKADLIILNTCAIRENVHNKVFGFIGRVKHLKMNRPDVMLALCGCMAQEEEVVNTIIDKYKWLDLVFGTHNIHNLKSLLIDAYNDKKTKIEVYSKQGDIIENLPIKRDSNLKAWVNITYGCDKFCTYCIVPYTRGKQRSRLKEDIINEVIELKNQGFMEITLLGQNVNSYGEDIKDYNYDFGDLLKDVAKTNIPRIRFVTSHPWDFSDKTIDTIANFDNVMPYIHLPVQSGSSKILKLMGRRYTKEEYINLYKNIKNKISNCSISTDIIVGFPNETDEDFNETLDLVDTCKFDGAYTFLYSKREGTPAAKFEDPISNSVKEERLRRLNEKINLYLNENNQKLMNTVMPVLIEGFSDKKNSLYGYTDTMKLVNIEGPKELIGKIVNVRITKIRTFNLYGELVNEG